MNACTATPINDAGHLKSEIIDLYASIHQATYRFIRLIARFDADDWPLQKASSAPRPGLASISVSDPTPRGRKYAWPEPLSICR